MSAETTRKDSPAAASRRWRVGLAEARISSCAPGLFIIASVMAGADGGFVAIMEQPDD